MDKYIKLRKYMLLHYENGVKNIYLEKSINLIILLKYVSSSLRLY